MWTSPKGRAQHHHVSLTGIVERACQNLVMLNMTFAVASLSLLFRCSVLKCRETRDSDSQRCQSTVET